MERTRGLGNAHWDGTGVMVTGSVNEHRRRWDPYSTVLSGCSVGSAPRWGGVRRSAQHTLLLPRDGHRHNTTAHGGLLTNFLMILFS